MEECYLQQSCRLQTATLLKVTLLRGSFSYFLNCGNGIKLCKSLCKSPIIVGDFSNVFCQSINKSKYYNKSNSAYSSDKDQYQDVMKIKNWTVVLAR